MQRGQNGAFIGAITYLIVYRDVATLIVEVFKLGYMLSTSYNAHMFIVCIGQAGSIHDAQEGAPEPALVFPRTIPLKYIVKSFAAPLILLMVTILSSSGSPQRK